MKSFSSWQELVCGRSFHLFSSHIFTKVRYCGESKKKPVRSFGLFSSLELRVSAPSVEGEGEVISSELSSDMICVSEWYWQTRNWIYELKQMDRWKSTCSSTLRKKRCRKMCRSRRPDLNMKQSKALLMTVMMYRIDLYPLMVVSGIRTSPQQRINPHGGGAMVWDYYHRNE